MSWLTRLRGREGAAPAPAPATPAADEAAPLPPPDLRGPLALAESHYLRGRFAELASAVPPPDATNAEATLECLRALLPSAHPPALESQLRSTLHQLLQATPDEQRRHAIGLAIAKSALRCGMPESRHLRPYREHPEIADDWRFQADAYETAYGARVIRESWGKVSRGRTLAWYFEQHRELLAGRRVLHVAPEPELLAWFRAAGLSGYTTADAFMIAVDHHVDLTALPFADGSFDLIVCHRVMEHVTDDASAYREMHRVLAPGGLLQVSVPQAVHRETSWDWLYPDACHHHHVRQYGLDLATRMTRAGFSVEVERWLIERPRDELLAAGAYPLRMYHAIRPD